MRDIIIEDKSIQLETSSKSWVYIDLQIKTIPRRFMCSPGAGTPQKGCVKSAQYLRGLIEW